LRICYLGKLIREVKKMVNSPSMWCGEWTIYTSKGVVSDKLVIRDTKADCAGPAWCALLIQIHKGVPVKIYRGEIENMDNIFRHMIFRIYRYTKNSTYDRYDAHIFPNRDKMAGSFSTIGVTVPSGVFLGLKETH